MRSVSFVQRAAPVLLLLGLSIMASPASAADAALTAVNDTTANASLEIPDAVFPSLDFGGLLGNVLPALAVGLGAGAFIALLGAPLERFLIAVGLRAGLTDPELVLTHPTRREIFDLVRERPGTHFREVQRALDLSNATTRWHLDRLESSGVVRSKRLTGKRVYYLNGGGSAAAPALLAAHLRNDNVRRIVADVLARPGINASALATRLGLNPMTVRWHVSKLSQTGFLEQIPNGRALELRVPAEHDALVRSTLGAGAAPVVEGLAAVP